MIRVVSRQDPLGASHEKHRPRVDTKRNIEVERNRFHSTTI